MIDCGMTGRVLVLPGGMPRALEFLDECHRLHLDAIGASSLAADPAASRYPRWAYLPNVGDPKFDQALAALIGAQKIDRVFTPHPVLWFALEKRLAGIAPRVRLLGPAPVESEMKPYRTAARLAREYPDLPLAASGAKRTAMTHAQRHSLWRHVELVPGMCDHAKISALMSVAPFVPDGDLVEIGSWWGKSAVLCALLAQFFDLGPLLCVDPWQQSALVQEDSPELLNETSAAIDANEAFAVFCANLLPYANGRVNYMRRASVEAALSYGMNEVSTPEFGSTRYSGEIALLHIDGNHDFTAVQADVDAWAPRVVPGGWVVMDDYTWSFGDGPRKVGDRYLARHADEIACSFVMGTALFMQRSIQARL